MTMPGCATWPPALSARSLAHSLPPPSPPPPMAAAWRLGPRASMAEDPRRPSPPPLPHPMQRRGCRCRRTSRGAARCFGLPRPWSSSFTRRFVEMMVDIVSRRGSLMMVGTFLILRYSPRRQPTLRSRACCGSPWRCWSGRSSRRPTARPTYQEGSGAARLLSRKRRRRAAAAVARPARSPHGRSWPLPPVLRRSRRCVAPDAMRDL